MVTIDIDITDDEYVTQAMEKFNIDILIECKNDVLVLENKIRSKDHSKQLQRYRQKIQTDKRYANKEKHYSYNY